MGPVPEKTQDQTAEGVVAEVREHYGRIAETGGSCCGPQASPCCGGEQSVSLQIGFMKPRDAGHHLSHFSVIERGPATHAVPSQHQLKRDLGIDAMPQQMSGERGNRRVTLPLRHTLSHQLTPLGKRAPDTGTADWYEDPAWQSSERHLIWPPSRNPGVRTASRMNRRGRHDVTTIAAKIDPLGKACAISGQPPGMGKIEVAPVATGNGLDRLGERPEPLL